MAATTLLPTKLTPAGVTALTPVACDVANGNEVRNLPGLVLVFQNTDAATQTAVFTSKANVAGFAVAGQTVSLPAGATKHVGNLPAAVFGDVISFTASNVNVKVAAYQAA
jgi:hypothetical protein